MATVEELACVYSSMILQDANDSITAEKIATLLKAANVNVEPYWPGIFAKALDSLNLKDLVSNVGGGAAAGAGAAPAAAAAAEPAESKDSKKEAKKEEEEEEEDDDMGFGLFD